MVFLAHIFLFLTLDAEKLVQMVLSDEVQGTFEILLVKMENIKKF